MSFCSGLHRFLEEAEACSVLCVILITSCLPYSSLGLPSQETLPLLCLELLLSLTFRKLLQLRSYPDDVPTFPMAGLSALHFLLSALGKCEESGRSWESEQSSLVPNVTEDGNSVLES